MVDSDSFLVLFGAIENFPDFLLDELAVVEFVLFLIIQYL